MKRNYIWRGFEWTRATVGGEDFSFYPGAQHALDDKDDFVVDAVEKGLLAEAPKGAVAKSDEAPRSTRSRAAAELAPKSTRGKAAEPAPKSTAKPSKPPPAEEPAPRSVRGKKGG